MFYRNYSVIMMWIFNLVSLLQSSVSVSGHEIGGSESLFFKDRWLFPSVLPGKVSVLFLDMTTAFSFNFPYF